MPPLTAAGRDIQAVFFIGTAGAANGALWSIFRLARCLEVSCSSLALTIRPVSQADETEAERVFRIEKWRQRDGIRPGKGFSVAAGGAYGREKLGSEPAVLTGLGRKLLGLDEWEWPRCDLM